MNPDRLQRLRAVAAVRLSRLWDTLKLDPDAVQAMKVAEVFADYPTLPQPLRAYSHMMYTKYTKRLIGNHTTDPYYAAYCVTNNPLTPIVFSMIIHAACNASEVSENWAEIATIGITIATLFDPQSTFHPDWRTTTTIALAKTIYHDRNTAATPILADALQDAGCEEQEVLNRLRTPNLWCRGEWTVDKLLGHR